MGNTTAETPLFRGGNNTELSAADIRSGLDKGTGLMKLGKGLSLNTDKFNKYIDQYGSAFEVDLKSIPKELNLINTPCRRYSFCNKSCTTNDPLCFSKLSESSQTETI